MTWDMHLFNIFIRHAGDSGRLRNSIIIAMVACGFSFYLFRKYKQLKTSLSFRAFLGSLLVLAAVALGFSGHFFIPFWFAHYRIYLLVKLAIWVLALGGGYMSCQESIRIEKQGQSNEYIAMAQSRYGIASTVVAGIVFALMLRDILFAGQSPWSPIFAIVLLTICGCILGIIGFREKNRNKFFSGIGLGLNLAILITIAILYLRTL